MPQVDTPKVQETPRRAGAEHAEPAPARAITPAAPDSASADRERTLERQRAIARDDPLAGALQRAQAARTRAASPMLQRMKIRGTDKTSAVSAATHLKHVVPVLDQATRARDEYGPRTFVTADSVLTAAVDANDHDFDVPAASRSDRFNFDIDLPVYQFEKTEAKPDGWKEGKPVNKTVDGASKGCEVGATKTGGGVAREKIEVTHFKMRF